MSPELVVPVLSSRQRVVLVVLLVLSVTATAVLVFGPGRGARDDIAHVRTDLDASREDINGTLTVSRRSLDQVTEQLETTKTSLEIQEQGLSVARDSQRLVGQTVESTDSIRRQTTDTVATIRRVLSALGGIRELRGDVTSVVAGVDAGVELARTTLRLARRTLQDGKAALAVAVTTLRTLERSEQLQIDLLDVARKTLDEVVEINRKIPFPPVFPTPDPGSAPRP